MSSPQASFNNAALPPKEEGVVRFATWNLGSAAPGYHGRGLADATQWLIDNDVDICVMQETDRFSKKSGYEDFPVYMEMKTGFYAFFGAASIERPHEPGRPRREYGNMILSRYPLIDTHKILLSGGPHEPSKQDAPAWGQDKRVLVAAKINIGGKDVMIGGTHLSNTTSWTNDESPVIREYQAKNLIHHMEKLAGPSLPMIVGGDLNCPGDSTEMAPLRHILSCPTDKIGPTWPLDYTKPVQTMVTSLDHIFTRAATAVRVYKRAYEHITDHAVVVADLRL